MITEINTVKEITTDQFDELLDLEIEYQNKYLELKSVMSSLVFPSPDEELTEIGERIAKKFSEAGLDPDEADGFYEFTVLGDYYYAGIDSDNYFAISLIEE